MGELGASLYTYPWDVVGDPAAAGRIRDLGFDDVTIAAAYHSVRAATPRHPRHRVIDAEAATYFPVRDPAWAGRRLTPLEGSAWAGGDAFATARDALEATGARVRAWVVATHSSAVGRTAPEHCVRNAFGDTYTYALCPSQPDVVSYARTLVAEAAHLCAVESMIIEGCGPLGFSHQSRHEKTAGADWSALDETLLSICFCSTCSQAYTDRDLSVDDLKQRIRRQLGTGHRHVQDVLGEDADRVLAVRADHTASLRTALTTAARDAGVKDLAFFASPDPWAVGPNAALPALLDADTPSDDPADVRNPRADSYVVGAWALDPSSPENVRAAASRATARIGAYTTILPPTPARSQDLVAHWSSLVDAGAEELHLYHGGLASTDRLQHAAAALAEVRALDPATRPTAHPGHDCLLRLPELFIARHRSPIRPPLPGPLHVTGTEPGRPMEYQSAQ